MELFAAWDPEEKLAKISHFKGKETEAQKGWMMRLRSHWQGVTEHLYRSRSDSDSRILFIDQLSAKTKEVRRVRTWRNEERMGDREEIAAVVHRQVDCT